jgi:DNA polymerase II large subunit
MYYIQKTFKNGIIHKTRMACEVIEAKGERLKIRITSHIVKGVPNCTLTVKKGNVIGYIEPNIESKYQQYKD